MSGDDWQPYLGCYFSFSAVPPGGLRCYCVTDLSRHAVPAPRSGALNCVWQIVGSRGTREGSGNSGHRAGGRRWRLAVIMCLDRASCLLHKLRLLAISYPSSFALPPPRPRPQGFRGAVRTCDVGSLVEWHCEVGRWGGGFLAVCRAAQQELKVMSFKVAADGRDPACQAPPLPADAPFCPLPPAPSIGTTRRGFSNLSVFFLRLGPSATSHSPPRLSPSPLIPYLSFLSSAPPTSPILPSALLRSSSPLFRQACCGKRGRVRDPLLSFVRFVLCV